MIANASQINTDNLLKEIESYSKLSQLYADHGFPGLRRQDLNHIRWLLAANPNTPSSILDHLSNEDIPSSVLERIADNPHTRPATLLKLATHENPRVRAAVAENPNIPVTAMWRLASDIHPDVRLRLAEGYYLPTPILYRLAKDDNPYVQNRANKTLNRLNHPHNVPLSVGCC